MPTDQGNGREAAEDVAAVKAAEELGMNVVFVATDGDHDTDEAHRVAHSKYARVYRPLVKQRHVEPRGGKGAKRRKSVKDHRAPPAQSLDKIVSLVISQGAFVHWPLSDLLHLLKNMRQRIRDSDGAGIALRAGAPTVSRAVIFEVTGNRGLQTAGRSGAMTRST
jgi:hypothetical protein